MNIRQMQIFRALCEELNFTKTAARLNMTQPAVSHVVAELERETGTPLFDRIGRRIYLTAAGKLLLEKITRLLELYDDISAGFAGETGLQPLKVGSCLTIANFWLPEIAGKFARACPDTPLEITVDIVSRVAAMLAGCAGPSAGKTKTNPAFRGIASPAAVTRKRQCRPQHVRQHPVAARS